MPDRELTIDLVVQDSRLYDQPVSADHADKLADSLRKIAEELVQAAGTDQGPEPRAHLAAQAATIARAAIRVSQDEDALDQEENLQKELENNLRRTRALARMIQGQAELMAGEDAESDRSPRATPRVATAATERMKELLRDIKGQPSTKLAAFQALTSMAGLATQATEGDPSPDLASCLQALDDLTIKFNERLTSHVSPKVKRHPELEEVIADATAPAMGAEFCAGRVTQPGQEPETVLWITYHADGIRITQTLEEVPCGQLNEADEIYQGRQAKALAGAHQEWDPQRDVHAPTVTERLLGHAAACRRRRNEITPTVVRQFQERAAKAGFGRGIIAAATRALVPQEAEAGEEHQGGHAATKGQLQSVIDAGRRAGLDEFTIARMIESTGMPPEEAGIPSGWISAADAEKLLAETPANQRVRIEAIASVTGPRPPTSSQ